MSKAYKRKRRLKSIGSMLYMIFISLLILPLAVLLQKLWRKKSIETQRFFGMSVNYDKAPEKTAENINDLDIKNILIRFKMDELDQINDYVVWMQIFEEQNIIMNIIQDPNLNAKELNEAFETIFKTFSSLVYEFQIGSTINRAKWGFYSVNEYLRFYRVAYKLKKSYPHIRLLGPSVIDFEYHYTIQALFNFYPISYDGCASLLYVDRTKTPENKQFGFNLLGKIDLLYSLLNLSPQTKNRIMITETNWPLKGSGDYAPTSDLECVTAEDAANYLVRYYLLALASSKVESVYWHQLIAHGFGLIDPLNDMQKRPSYFAFKTLVSELQEAKNIIYKEHAHYFELSYTNDKHEAKALWTNNSEYNYPVKAAQLITRDGNSEVATKLSLTASPIYLITKELS
jgi:hypothetical protein